MIVCIYIDTVSDDVEARLSRGEVQRYCGWCGIWRWDDECDHPGKQIEAEFWATAKKIEKEVRKKYPTQEDRYLRQLRKARRDGEVE